MSLTMKDVMPPPVKQMQAVNVLMVDDKLDNLLALEAILESPDRTLVKAQSGEEALKRLLVEEYAVILLDVKMKGMDGYETASLIRQREKTRDVPIIFLTGHHSAEAQVLKGYARGAVDYIIKPVVPEVLRSKVDIFIELAKRTAALTRKNAELEAAQKALQEKSKELSDRVQELGRINAELERFAYVASHDLQEPLRRVKRYVQLLARRYEGKLDSEADQFIGFAEDGALRMERVIQDLLTYAQVGVRSVPRKLLDCELVFDRAVSNIMVEIVDSKAVITHDPLPQLPAIDSQLVQVFQNLLENAIKFCAKGTTPRVHVSAHSVEDRWVFAVKDNGIGIEPQHMERVFTLFQRLDMQAGQPGNGIGLPICRKIVENHGGRIWVSSQPGHGSTFYFTLPS